MKEKRESEKPEDMSMSMSKADFDALIRHALGVPPQPKKKPKKKAPKKSKA